MDSPKNKKYVLGFLFSSDEKSVILIKKTKPDFQIGLLNGVGGKIEDGESSAEAMAREFKEETTAITFPENWEKFALMYGDGWHVECFRHTDQYAFDIATTNTDEEIFKIHLLTLNDYPHLSNIPWLIYMALDKNFGHHKFAIIQY